MAVVTIEDHKITEEEQARLALGFYRVVYEEIFAIKDIMRNHIAPQPTKVGDGETLGICTKIGDNLLLSVEYDPFSCQKAIKVTCNLVSQQALETTVRRLKNHHDLSLAERDSPYQHV